jgi:hypothetical protein
MLHHTVFPNYRVRSWSTVLIILRVLFFFLDKAYVGFKTEVILYPYLMVQRGEWYRLFTGYLRC